MENLPPDEVLRGLKNKAELRNKWRPINQARYIMYSISGLLILSAIVVFFTTTGDLAGFEIVLYVMLGMAGLFIGFSIWARKQPRAALITTISVFSIFVLLGYVGNPTEGLSGLWWQIPILAMFIRGLLATKHLQYKQESQELLDDL